jgi:spore maturation protein CgeB
MEIALHFLRHGNRDEQDSRTFEIPACKIFMIAEKSLLHLQLFKENEEAVFFETKEELLEKVKFYRDNNEERERIAKNGYTRCISSGYDHRTRMEKVVQKIMAE